MSFAVETLLLFFLYSFLGWCCEVIFAAVKRGVFVNRGFLNGPLCPIYGLGVVSAALLLAPLEENTILLFLASMALSTLIEYLLGLISDKLLHLRLWDYSNVPFNLSGYVCLKFSLVWGLACVFILRLVHPFFLSLVRLIPRLPGTVAACLFSALFLADLIATLAVARGLPERAHALEEVETALRALSDGIDEHISEGAVNLTQKNQERREELERRRRQLLEQRHRIHARLLRAYPALRTSKSREALDRLRAALKAGERHS